MIERDPGGAESRSYDLVVVGGGIYGVATALESVARGLRPLVLERADFGGATSAQTLRILHGGLRYLQSLDVKRLRRSVEQRRWWLTTFPELVHPFACLMPLYGGGLKRPGTLRAALFLNDVLSIDRNRDVPQDRRIPSGTVMNPAEVRDAFPGCEPAGLLGGALWHDASMDSPHRLIVEMIRWIVAAGGTVLNYVSARELCTDRGRVIGVVGIDELDGRELRFSAPLVVNAAGPWCGEVAGRFDADRAELFRPSMAYNVLLRKTLPASVTVAVSPPGAGAPVYFLRPVGDLTFAGTAHVAWGEDRGLDPEPTERELLRFLEDLGAAVPDLSAGTDDVLRVFPGLLPARAPGSPEPLRHPRIVDHGLEGGPRGLVTVSGVKFTTAPAVAREALRRIYGSDRPADRDGLGAVRPAVRRWPSAEAWPACLDSASNESFESTLGEIVREEAVVFAEDLVERRLDWTLSQVDVEAAARRLAERFPNLALKTAPKSGG